MPKVPLAQQSVSKKGINYNPIAVGKLDAGVMGENVMQAQQGLMKTFGKASDMASEYATNEMKLQSESRTSDAEFNARSKLNDMMISQEKDDQGIPKGILNRELGSAQGVSGDFNSKADEIINSSLTDLNPYEQDKLRSSIRNYHETLYNKAVSHEADQKDKAETITFKNNQESIISGAALYADDGMLLTDIQEGSRRQSERMMAKGHSAESVAMENKKFADQMVHSNIITKLENDPNGAYATLDANKDLVSGEFYAKTKGIIEGKQFDDMRLGLWNKSFSSMKMSDGNIDLARVEKNINGAAGFSNDQKQKLYDFAQAKAGEHRQQKAQAEASNDESFHDDLAQAQQQGLPLEDALKLSGKYAHKDNSVYDAALKEEIVKKLYDRPTRTDTGTYLDTYEGIKNGTIKREEIDNHFKKGLLNVADYKGLVKDSINAELHGKGDKNFERVKLLADETFGKGKEEERRQYLYEMRQATKSMKPEEAFAYAKNATKDVVVSVGMFWDSKAPKYEVDLMQRDAGSLAIGKLQSDLGQDTIKAIAGAHLSKKGNDSWGAGNIADFTQQAGGYENFKPGAPGTKALEFLKSKGWPITPKNINWAIAGGMNGK